jgi:hypothetical protein
VVSWCLFAVLQMGNGEDGAGEVVWGVAMVGGAGMLMGVGGD